MRRIRVFKPFAVAAALALLGLSSARAETGAEIDALLRSRSPAPLARRIEDASALFLGRPDLDGPLGEGPAGLYDKDPLYRFDGFDCTTYVETVMALSLAGGLGDFERLMDRIRYKDGVVSFAARNHFPDADWIPNNVRAGFVRDVTGAVAGGEPVRLATAVVDKDGWYRKMGAARLRVPGASPQELDALLARLNAEGRAVPPETVSLPYVGLESIFPGGESVNRELLDRIPSGAIVNVVRPNWDLTKAIGTRMNVSHQAFAIREGGRLVVREATSVGEKKVVDVDLVDFLRPFLKSPTIKGVNFLEVVGR